MLLCNQIAGVFLSSVSERNQLLSEFLHGVSHQEKVASEASTFGFIRLGIPSRNQTCLDLSVLLALPRHTQISWNFPQVFLDHLKSREGLKQFKKGKCQSFYTQKHKLHHQKGLGQSDCKILWKKKRFFDHLSLQKEQMDLFKFFLHIIIPKEWIYLKLLTLIGCD